MGTAGGLRFQGGFDLVFDVIDVQAPELCLFGFFRFRQAAVPLFAGQFVDAADCGGGYHFFTSWLALLKKYYQIAGAGATGAGANFDRR